jgi:hypothetical protein
LLPTLTCIFFAECLSMAWWAGFPRIRITEPAFDVFYSRGNVSAALHSFPTSRCCTSMSATVQDGSLADIGFAILPDGAAHEQGIRSAQKRNILPKIGRADAAGRSPRVTAAQGCDHHAQPPTPVPACGVTITARQSIRSSRGRVTPSLRRFTAVPVHEQKDMGEGTCRSLPQEPHQSKLTPLPHSLTTEDRQDTDLGTVWL